MFVFNHQIAKGPPHGGWSFNEFCWLWYLTEIKKPKIAKKIRLKSIAGCRHSSVDSSAPSILPPRIRVPSTSSMLFSIYIIQILCLSFELECEKNENRQKRPRLAHFLKKYYTFLVRNIVIVIKLLFGPNKLVANNK